MLTPLRWSTLTWLAALLWLCGGVPPNIPPSVSYTVNPETGELEDRTSYNTLSDYPFPIGWPFHYVKPDDPALWTTPIPANGVPIVPGPSRVSYFAITANVAFIATTLACLVFLLQLHFPRFSLLSLVLLPAIAAVYILAGRLITQIAGYNAYWYWEIAIYFSPLFFATLHALRVRPANWISRGIPARADASG